eukprot:GHVR01151762.1.p1 GENE.GHVR01151762.1~~GHVR01151762.1.p1  ORF type:complete len:223 (+),score=13.00 GHVR01151762.1:683-1351(+)
MWPYLREFPLDEEKYRALQETDRHAHPRRQGETQSTTVNLDAGTGGGATGADRTLTGSRVSAVMMTADTHPPKERAADGRTLNLGRTTPLTPCDMDVMEQGRVPSYLHDVPAHALPKGVSWRDEVESDRSLPESACDGSESDPTQIGGTVSTRTFDCRLTKVKKRRVKPMPLTKAIALHTPKQLPKRESSRPKRIIIIIKKQPAGGQGWKILTFKIYIFERW